MNEHITADDREILDMLHDVVYRATDKEGDYDEWLLNKRKTMKALTDILVGLIVNTPSYTEPPSIEAAVLAEQEACAKAAEDFLREVEGVSFGVGAVIRARGKK